MITSVGDDVLVGSGTVEPRSVDGLATNAGLGMACRIPQHNLRMTADGRNNSPGYRKHVSQRCCMFVRWAQNQSCPFIWASDFGE